MSHVTLYGDRRSSYVRTARMTFAEKGVAFDYVESAPKDDAVVTINPFAKIPAMRHGDFDLYETAAITRYVDSVFAGPPLQPADPVGRALVDQWLSAVGDYIYDTMIRRYVLQYVFPRGDDGAPDRAVIDPALDQLRRQLDVLDSAYDGRPYLVGDRLSLADLFVAPIFSYVWQMPEGEQLLADHQNIAEAWPNITSRESFQRTDPQPDE